MSLNRLVNKGSHCATSRRGLSTIAEHPRVERHGFSPFASALVVTRFPAGFIGNA